MPKPAFIANIDEANAEIERLFGTNETLSADVLRITNDLNAANGLLEESNTNVTRLTDELGTANGQVTQLTSDLKTARASVSSLQTELATSKNSATKTIAKAGIVPNKENGSTGDDNLDKSADTKQLTGLRRAIAAHTARVAPQNQQ